jgi:transposase
MPWRKSIPIELTDYERTTLESTVRKAKSSQRDVFRANIILEAANGAGNKSIARKLKTTSLTVRNWRKQFTRGRLKGLKDQRRSGRPCVFSL